MWLCLGRLREWWEAVWCLLAVAGLEVALRSCQVSDCCVPPSAVRLPYESPAYRSCSLKYLYIPPRQFPTRCLPFRLTRLSSSRLWASRRPPPHFRPTAKHPNHFLCSYTTQEFDELCFEFGIYLSLLVQRVVCTNLTSQVLNSMKTCA